MPAPIDLTGQEVKVSEEAKPETEAVMIGLTKGCGPEWHLAVPADEAREFLDNCIACRGLNELGDAVSQKARELRAVLPE